MSDKINNGMRNISSMSMDPISMGSMNMGQAGDRSSRVPQKVKVNKKLISLIAAIVALIILITFIAGIGGGGAEKKAENAVIMMLCRDADEIDFEKLFPEEIADAYYDYIREYMKTGGNYSAQFDEINICGITEIKGRDAAEWMEDIVMEFIEILDADLQKKDVNISKGYMVLFQDEDKDVYSALVVKVNGKYGMYCFDMYSIH